jgi:hypothetical protein
MVERQLLGLLLVELLILAEAVRRAVLFGGAARRTARAGHRICGGVGRSRERTVTVRRPATSARRDT